MPRKSNTTLVTEDALIEAVTTRVTDQLMQEMDARFTRLESAFARPPPQHDETSTADTRGTKRLAENDASTDEHSRKAPPQPTPASSGHNTHSSVEGFTEHRVDSARRTLPTRDQHASQPAILIPDMDLTSAGEVNNNNPAWKAWLAASHQAPSHPAAASSFPTHRPVLYDTNGLSDHDLDAQVRHILETTPHHLKGNVQPGVFPFKFVSHGPDRKKLSFNTLTLSEHILGMFRIIDDDRIDPAIKPDILTHMREVVEDASEFDWNHVRRWSEEVFDLIAEGRLPGGWSAQSKIQNLRTGMSRVESARITPVNMSRLETSRPSTSKDTVNSRRYPSATASNPQSEVFRGGPPCSAYNAPQGCSLLSGHLLQGKKQIHVCSYCLINTAAAHPHSEAQCRTKQRHSASHF